MARKTAHRKGHRKAHRKTHRKTNRRYRGGANLYADQFAPASLNTGMPTQVNLMQGQQQADFHKYQHGGAAVPLVGGPYPGVVTESSVLPGDLVASARLLPLNRAFDEIRGLSDQAGGRRKGRKGSRKSRKANRKSRKNRKANRKSRKANRKSRKNRKANRKSRKANRKSRKANRRNRRQAGGLYRWGGGARVDGEPMSVGDSTKMLISGDLANQAGLNPEWKLAENPASFAPRN